MSAACGAPLRGGGSPFRCPRPSRPQKLLPSLQTAKGRENPLQIRIDEGGRVLNVPRPRGSTRHLRRGTVDDSTRTDRCVCTEGNPGEAVPTKGCPGAPCPPFSAEVRQQGKRKVPEWRRPVGGPPPAPPLPTSGRTKSPVFLSSSDTTGADVFTAGEPHSNLRCRTGAHAESQGGRVVSVTWREGNGHGFRRCRSPFKDPFDFNTETRRTRPALRLISDNAGPRSLLVSENTPHLPRSGVST